VLVYYWCKRAAAQDRGGGGVVRVVGDASVVLEEVCLDLGLLSRFHDRTLLHLYALNRGVLIPPFHNMALMAPTITEAQVDRHSAVFAEAPYELID
jgi:hypothetical protein